MLKESELEIGDIYVMKRQKVLLAEIGMNVVYLKQVNDTEYDLSINDKPYEFPVNLRFEVPKNNFLEVADKAKIKKDSKFDRISTAYKFGVNAAKGLLKESLKDSYKREGISEQVIPLMLKFQEKSTNDNEYILKSLGFNVCAVKKPHILITIRMDKVHLLFINLSDLISIERIEDA